MDNKIRLGVISDLHCTYNREYDSPDTILFSNTMKNGNKKNQVQELLKLISENDIKCDYLLCPGDITNKIDVQGLISGFGYLQEIEKALDAKKLICVPGNHDVDSHKSNKQIFQKEDDPLWHLDKENYPLPDTILSQSLLSKNYCLYQDEQIAILCINSVNSTTSLEDGSQIIHISDSTLSSIEDELKRIPDSVKVRVALTHHHPLSYTDVNYRCYDKNDIIDNGDKLISIIENYHFGLFIHGHKHRARLMSYGSVALFCSGGFSALQNMNMGDDENTFHIVELDNSEPMRGIIHTWSYSQSAGWKKPSNVFPEITGFGLTKTAKQLAEEIGSYYQDKYSDKQTIIQFPDFINQFPDFLYLHHNDKSDFNKELAQYNCHYVDGKEPEDKMLIYSPSK